MDDTTTVTVEIGFGVLALLGLFVATKPRMFARYFLAEWQRERVGNNMEAVSWTGWVICGLGLFTVIVSAIAHNLR